MLSCSCACIHVQRGGAIFESNDAVSEQWGLEEFGEKNSYTRMGTKAICIFDIRSVPSSIEGSRTSSNYITLQASSVVNNELSNH